MEEAIEQWQKDNLLDSGKADDLRKSISSYRSEFDSVAFYASIAAVSCALMAFGALVLDEKWIERLRKLFAFSELVVGFLFAALSLVFIWIAKKRQRKYSYTVFANESFTILIALAIGVSVVYFTKSIVGDYQFYGFSILLTAWLYGITSYYLQSKLLWVCMLLALISSWATLTYAWSADAAHAYFWRMNYPLRMTLFGAVLLLITYLFRNEQRFKSYFKLTWYSCWIFFLISCLLLSASGNWSYDDWYEIRQQKLFLWALAYSAVLILILIYAIRHKDENLRDIVIVFFLFNIYTRYFEYFWDRTNKGLFFSVLALSFWLIGKKAEQLRRRLS